MGSVCAILGGKSFNAVVPEQRSEHPGGHDRPLKQLHDEIACHCLVRELSASVRYIGAEMQVGVKIACQPGRQGT